MILISKQFRIALSQLEDGKGFMWLKLIFMLKLTSYCLTCSNYFIGIISFYQILILFGEIL